MGVGNVDIDPRSITRPHDSLLIYQPFDPTKRGHFVDCGQILDFALHADSGRVLDLVRGMGGRHC